mgnify:CR=1 FL=1
MLVWKKKKSAGAIEKNSVSVFRVFEQKKRKGVCRFLNPDLATRDTGTRRHTGTKEKSEQRSQQQQQQQQQQHAIIILTKSRKVNNTTINAHQHHFVGATDNRKFFFIICRVWVLIFESFVVVTNRWWDPIFPEEGRVSKNLRREWFERIFEPFFWWFFFFDFFFSSLLFLGKKKNDRIFCRTQRATQRITHVSPPFAHEKRRRTSDYTKKARIVVILSLLLL